MKNYKQEDLEGFIEIEASIQCSNCKNGETIMFADTGEEEFFEMGWRATRDKVYCPVCAPLKLKLPQIKSTKNTTVGK